MTGRRGTPEKHVQQHIVTLLRSVGADVFVIGTRRRHGDYQGTMMTPGIPDLYAFLPPSPHPGRRDSAPVAVWIEVKAARGRLRPEQTHFQQRCLETQTPHVVGGVDDVIAFLIRGAWLKPEQIAHYRQPEGVSPV